MAGFLVEAVGLLGACWQRLEGGLHPAADFLLAQAVVAEDFPEKEVPLVVLMAGPQVGKGLLPLQAVVRRCWGLVLWAEMVGLMMALYVNRWWQFFWSS